jgi:hypothetical protein
MASPAQTWKAVPLSSIRRIVVLVCAIALAALATPALGLSGKLGIQGIGVNNSLTGSLPNEGSWQGQWAFGAGILAEVDLTADIAISFQPGLTPRNCQQQFKRKGEIIGTIDYELDYLSMPLLVRVTGDPVGVRGFVTAGLDLSVLLEARYDAGEGSEDITNEFESASLGALFGAGAMIPVGRHFVVLEARYVQGLNDIVVRDGDQGESGLSSPSIKYKGLELLVGFAFTLGGD